MSPLLLHGILVSIQQNAELYVRKRKSHRTPGCMMDMGKPGGKRITE
jgi:hypothetical protein